MPLLRLLFATLLASAAAAAQSIPGFGAVRLRLSEGATSELRVQWNGADLPLTEGFPLNKDGLALRLHDGALEIETSGDRAVVESALGSWTMDLPPKSRASIHAAFPQKRFQIASASQNRSSILLMFSDKASAEMLPASSLDLDFFPDLTYSLRSPTNVVATTADGQKIKLSHLHPPVQGGELKQIVDARGQSRFQRATPAIRLEFSGGLNETVRVKGPGLDLALVPDQEKHAAFANGSSVLLKHVPARQIVEWQVIKGVGQFGIAGFSCWKSTATSGQSGFLQWNPIRKIVDLGNRSPAPVFVQLSGRLHASIAAGATFQYAQFQDCSSFTANASGAEVFLVNRETGEATPVLHGVSFNEGSPVGPPSERPKSSAHPISFGWESEARIQLRDDTRLLGLSAGQEESIVSGRNELQIAFTQNGNVTMRAVHGAFEILPGFIPQLSLDIPEGGAVVLSLDRRRSLFSAHAAHDSAAATRVVAQGRTYLFLAGSARLSVVVGENTFIPETAAAWIFFEGAGGESTFTSGRQPAPLIRPDRFDASRIFQQPVSVLE